MSGSITAQSGKLPASANSSQIARAIDRLPEQIVADERRQIDLQMISFQIPAGFHAQSDPAVFFVPHLNPATGERLPGAVEMLTVETLSENSATASIEGFRATLKRQLAERQKKYAGLGQLAPGLAASTAVILDRQALIDNRWPALLFATATKISQSDPDDKGFFEREAYIFIARHTVVHLKYETATNGSVVAARFARFVTSLRPNSKTPPNRRSVSNFWKRRDVGFVTLEVPAVMVPQRSFVYEKDAPGGTGSSINPEDHDRNVLRLRVLDPDDQMGLQTSETAGAAAKNKMGLKDKTGLQTLLINTSFWRGEMIAADDQGAETPGDVANPANPGNKYIRLQITLKAADNMRLVLVGEAPAESAEELKNILLKWVQTFVPASGRHF